MTIKCAMFFSLFLSDSRKLGLQWTFSHFLTQANSFAECLTFFRKVLQQDFFFRPEKSLHRCLFLCVCVSTKFCCHFLFRKWSEFVELSCWVWVCICVYFACSQWTDHTVSMSPCMTVHRVPGSTFHALNIALVQMCYSADISTELFFFSLHSIQLILASFLVRPFRAVTRSSRTVCIFILCTSCPVLIYILPSLDTKPACDPRENHTHWCGVTMNSA